MMQPANPQPQPQPAADDSANAVTEIAARVEAAEHEEWFPYTEWTMSEAEDALWNRAPDYIRYLLAALTREREALAAMTTRALAAEAANELHRKAFAYIANMEGIAPDNDTNPAEAGKEYRVLFWDVVEMAKVAQAASADTEPTGGVNDAKN